MQTVPRRRGSTVRLYLLIRSNGWGSEKRKQGSPSPPPCPFHLVVPDENLVYFVLYNDPTPEHAEKGHFWRRTLTSLENQTHCATFGILKRVKDRPLAKSAQYWQSHQNKYISKRKKTSGSRERPPPRFPYKVKPTKRSCSRSLSFP